MARRVNLCTPLKNTGGDSKSLRYLYSENYCYFIQSMIVLRMNQQYYHTARRQFNSKQHILTSFSAIYLQLWGIKRDVTQHRIIWPNSKKKDFKTISNIYLVSTIRGNQNAIAVPDVQENNWQRRNNKNAIFLFPRDLYFSCI